MSSASEPARPSIGRIAPLPAGTLADRAGQVLRALAETFVADAPPGLPAAARTRALDDARDFALEEIRRMPPYLRVGTRLGLAAFDLLGTLRHGRRFPRLAPARRAAWVAFWSEGPIPPARDFLRLCRGMLLLAYYDSESLAEPLEACGAPAERERERSTASSEGAGS